MPQPSHFERVAGFSGVNGYGQPRVWCLECAQGDATIPRDDPGMDEARCWCCKRLLFDVADEMARRS